MMLRDLGVSVLTLGLAFAGGAARADLLVSEMWGGGAQVSVGVPSTLTTFQYGVGVGGTASTPDYWVFQDLLIDTGDDGVVFEATAANTANWAALVASVTGDPPADVSFVGQADALSWNGQLLAPSNLATLQGATITSFELVLTDISFVSPGSDPPGLGMWTDIAYRQEFRVYGVPEPTSIAILLPLLMLPRRHRRLPSERC